MKQEKEKRYVDLHTHTDYSDGLYTRPRQNVMLAALRGIDVFSITDHDTTLGYDEAKQEAEKIGITLIPGVEITTPRYHLLALNFNPDDKVLLDFLQCSKDIQRTRCKQRVGALIDYGFPMTFQDVTSVFPESRLAKYNIFASMLLNSACRQVMEREYPLLSPLQRFRKYFGKNGPLGNLPDGGVNPKDAISCVHAAGGMIGIAHPFKDIGNMSEMYDLLNLGIDFVEIQPHFRKKETGNYTTEDFERFAIENNLPFSYGSDYHGPLWDRTLLERGENVLSGDLEKLLNQGYVKIPNLEGVC
jgi:hypothetical protein